MKTTSGIFFLFLMFFFLAGVWVTEVKAQSSEGDTLLDGIFEAMEEADAEKKREAAERQARERREAAERQARERREAAERQARERREAAERQARERREATERQARERREATERQAINRRIWNDTLKAIEEFGDQYKVSP